MAVGFFEKVAVMTAALDPVLNGSRLLNPKPMPPSSWPSSMAVPVSWISSMRGLSISVPVRDRNPTTLSTWIFSSSFHVCFFQRMTLNFFLFLVLVDRSHIQITALRGLWTNRESHIWIGRVAVVRELEPLPERCWCSSWRIADYGSSLWHRRNPPRPSSEGVWHTPPIQGQQLSSWPSQGENSKPVQAMRCSIQTSFGFGWVL